jgi:hypothetical protein
VPEPGTSWAAADYRRPLVLVCLVADRDAELGVLAWHASPGLNVELVVVRTSGGENPARVAEQAIEAAAGRPYAVLAVGAAAAVLAVVVPELGVRPMKLVVVAAAPPAEWSTELPISALSGLWDRAVPPERMAGWRRVSGPGFGVHVFDAGGDFVRTCSMELLEVVQDELQVGVGQVPGHGFDAVRTEWPS